MALIKRDLKPANPETLIMISLFEKMIDTKSKLKYFDRLRIVLRMKLNDIRLKSKVRGGILEHEI